MQAYTGTVVINRPPADVFAFVRVPENQPRWAVNFVRSTEAIGDGRYRMQTPLGELVYRVDANADHGVVDLVFDTPAGDSVLPTRVVPHPAGSLFLFTLSRQPGMPDEAWEGGKQGLDEELAVLKGLLEG